LIALLHTVTLLEAATIKSTIAGGPWATGSTWVGGAAPTATDAATIATTGANSVTLGADAACTSLTINANARLVTNLYTLTVTGTFTKNGTFTPGAGTVVLGLAGAQTLTGTTTFNNLTIAGSGIKTFSNRPTVNGIFSVEGSATASTYPNYGAAATLQYNGITANRFVGSEFRSTFTASGGLIIDTEPYAVTLDANKTGFASNIYVKSGTFDLSTFTINRNGAGGSLTVDSGATLRIGGTNLKKLTLPTNFNTHNIDAGSTIEYDGTTQAIATLNSNQSYGNLLLSNSGTKTLPNSVLGIAGNITTAGTAAVTYGTGTGTVILNGADQTIDGTTAISFYNLTLAGSGTKTLTTRPSVTNIFSMEGTANASTYATLGTSSTIQYKGTTSRTIGVEFPATFAGSGGIIIDQGDGDTITLNGTKSALAGILNIKSGTFDLTGYTINRSSAGGSLTLAAGTSLLIGSTNTLPSNYSTHNINASSTVEYYGANQAVAALYTLQGYGNLILSGSGTKTLPASVLPINGNFENNGISVNSTGNTLTFSGSTAQYIGGTTTSTFNNLTFNNTSSGVTFNIDETVNGAFTMNTNAKVTAGSYTHTIGGNFANSGTFTAGTSTIILSGAAQTVTGTAIFNNLTLSGSGSKTLTAAQTVNGILSMEGTATVSVPPTYGAASTIQYYGTGRTIGNEFPVAFAGTGGVIIDPGVGNTILLNASKNGLLGNLNVKSGKLDLSTFTMNRSSAGGTLTLASATTLRIGGTNSLPSNYTTHSFDINSTAIFSGSGAQSIGGSSSTIFGNLTLDNSSGVTLNFNQTVNGVLTLSNGLLNTGSNTLTVGCSGSIANASAARFVNGKLALVFCSAGSRVFPIGKDGNYRPLTLNYTTLTDSSTVTAEQIEDTIPGTIPSDIDLFKSRYWQLSQTGSSSYSFALTLDSSDWSPTSYLKMIKGNGVTNAHNFVTTPNYTNSTDFTSFGNFGLGQLNCVTWLGSTNNWFTGSNWTSGSKPNSTDDIRIPSAVSFYPSISGASPSNDISIASIGKLQVLAGASLTLESGPLLTFQSGATVTTGSGSKIVLESDARYLNLSSSTPILEVQRQLTGTKGWRMLSSPVATTFSDMFKDSLVTQGFTDSDFTTLQPNLLWWDETDLGTTLQSWRKPSNITESIADGMGYFHYVFNGAGKLELNGKPSGSNYSDTLPITMSATGVENYNGIGTYDFSLTNSTKPATQDTSATDTIYYDLNALDQGWNLIGNPTASTLNWDASSGWTKTDVENSIYIWDPSANSGEGEYLVWNGTVGTLGSGKIPPFQAFWVHVTDSTTLKFTNDVKIDTIGTFLRSSQIDETISLPITLSVGDLQTTSYLSFSADGITGPDRKDAYRLQSMSDKWLGLYSLSSAKYVSPLVINHLPLIKDESITIPLYYDAQLNSSSTNQYYTLNWKLPENWPSDWKISIQDHKTESSISMTENASYTFGGVSKRDLSASANKLPLPQRLVQNLSNPTMLRSSSSVPPFTIVISKGKEIDYMAPKPQLLGNYPNPFEKLTTVRFSLTEKAKAHIDVYTSQGQKIATLADGEYPAGISEVLWDAKSSTPGLYFLRFISGETIETKKGILMK